MRLLHHHDAPRGETHDDVDPAGQDPVAAAVWRTGLTGAPAAGLVIHAPHASELVTPTAPDAHAA